mmetsp:Transcript_87453/g.245492  ORF Transcript_87453/g.245492 Transcript_87453/m.245492 type:complete len:207 (+) Transcript_87453:404-1024(+)
MPPLPVVRGVARQQFGLTLAIMAGSGLTSVRKTERMAAAAGARCPEEKSLNGYEPTVLIDVLEALHEPGERAALQALFHVQDVLHAAIPRAASRRQLLSVHRRELRKLLAELAEPSYGGAHAVRVCRTRLDVIPRGSAGVARDPPHVCHVCVLRQHDLAAAKPTPQGLVKVLAAPAYHVLVVATGLVPPALADCQKAARDDGNIGV